MPIELASGTYKVIIRRMDGRFYSQYLINCTTPNGYDLGTGDVVATAFHATRGGAMRWAHRQLPPRPVQLTEENAPLFVR
jgi:hypothetical protein